MQLAPLTLETYMRLHGALTRGSQTVQQALPGDSSRLKAQELKQVGVPHRHHGIPRFYVSLPTSNACMPWTNGRASDRAVPSCACRSCSFTGMLRAAN